MKRTALFLVFVMIATALCGCMSKEEKKESMEDVKLARPIVEEYISENYSGAKIKNISYLTERPIDSSAIADLEKRASGYCVAFVNSADTDFRILIDTDTGNCWDTYASDSLKAEIKSELAQKLGSDFAPDGTELYTFDSSLIHTLTDSDAEGFFKKGTTADDILNSASYYITALFKYSGRDISKADLSKINAEKYRCGMSFTLLKVKDCKYLSMNWIHDRAGMEFSVSKDFYSAALDSTNSIVTYYNGEDFTYGEPEYCKYKSEQIGEFTFFWNSAYVDVKPEETGTLSEFVSDTFDSRYTPCTQKGVQLTYNVTRKNDCGYISEYDICCSVSKEYAKKYIGIIYDKGGINHNSFEYIGTVFPDGDTFTVNIYTSKSGSGIPITVGIYEKV